MATKLYDLAVSTGSYTDRNGNEKKEWKNIGAIWESDKNGQKSVFMMLDATFNPAAIERRQGSSSILVSMFKPKDKQQSNQQSQQTQDYSEINFGNTGNIDPEPYNPDTSFPF